MKKFLAVLLLMVLCTSACLPAFASGEAEFGTTGAFLATLDEAKINYVVNGIDSDGDEHVYLRNPDSDIPYTIHYFFESDLEHTSIFAWNLITFDEKDLLRVMHVCNTLNADYNYTCFYVDTTDNTVTCSMNLIYRDDNVGMVCADATLYMMAIIESAWPTLAPYDR